MTKLLRTCFLLILLLSAGGEIRAQVKTSTATTSGTQESDTASSEPQGIIYERDEADSLMPALVYSFEGSRRKAKIHELRHPTLDPTGAELLDAVQRLDGHYYLGLGALGQSHLSLLPHWDGTLSLLNPQGSWLPLSRHWQPDANSVYMDRLHRWRYYQTLRPYTLLRYGSSTNKDYQIGIVHTQNIRPRWNLAFEYDLVSREGVYTNSGVGNHVLDFTTNYYSSDARYQLQAGIGRHSVKQQENGGVDNDTTCWSSTNRAGVPVNMYYAMNHWRNFDVEVHQTYNTVRQFIQVRPVTEKKTDTLQLRTTLHDSVTLKDSVVVRDSIVLRDTIVGYDTLRPYTPRVFNSGVLGMDLRFSRQRRHFYDSEATSWFYNLGAIDTSFYYDSTALLKYSGDLYWTNDAYMRHRWQNPLVVTVGVRPEADVLRLPGGDRRQMSVSAFASAVISWGTLRLSADAEEVNGGERNGDYRLHALLDASRGHSHFAATLLSEAQAPDIMYYHNEGCYNWDIATYSKIKRQQAALEYRRELPDSVGGWLRSALFRGSATLLGDNVWIDASMRPVQGHASGLLTQLQAQFHLQFGWFHLQLQEQLQHSSDNAVVRVPLYAGKHSLYADLHVFKRALHLQTGVDLRYHTRYLADGWNPVLGAFYRQEDIEVGGYLVADAWVTLQVKRATIYAKVSHLNAPLESDPAYFSLPHYPLEDLGVYWGVIWKFFN